MAENFNQGSYIETRKLIVQKNRKFINLKKKIEFDSTFVQHCCEHLKEISDLKHLLAAEKKKSKHWEHEISNRLQEEITKPDRTNNVLELEKYKNFYRTKAEYKNLRSLTSRLIMKATEVSKENSDLKFQLGVLNRKLGVYEVISSNSNGNTDCLESKLKELLSELEDKDKKMVQFLELAAARSNCDSS